MQYHTRGYTDNHNHIHCQHDHHHHIQEQWFRDLYDEVMVSLGGNLVDIELEPKDIKVCFNKQKRTMKQKGHIGYDKRYLKITPNGNSESFAMPSGVIMVTQLIIPGTSTFGSLNGFTSPAIEEIFGSRSIVGTSTCDQGRIDLLTYELSMGYLESLQRFASNNKEFHYNELTNELTIWGKPLNGIYLAEQYMELGDDHYASIDWIVRWTIAEAKQILGQAYRKFQSVAGPTGEVSLNGDSLISEAQQEKEALLMDIENFVDGAIDYAPIVFG